MPHLKFFLFSNDGPPIEGNIRPINEKDTISNKISLFYMNVYELSCMLGVFSVVEQNVTDKKLYEADALFYNNLVRLFVEMHTKFVVLTNLLLF
jgi:hypothetical protein